jgi:putative PIN family toxin of toxin-antitoxin system
MRVVIDTNVLVSGIINPHGGPGRIIDALLAEQLSLLFDDRTMGEYREVLMRPAFSFPREDVETLLDFIEFSGERISAVTAAGVILPDADDLPFLEVAIAGSADALVTGNTKHFKPLRGSHQVRICSPADFLERVI